MLNKLNYSPFCLKIRCHGNEGQLGININSTVKLADPDHQPKTKREVDQMTGCWDIAIWSSSRQALQRMQVGRQS